MDKKKIYGLILLVFSVFALLLLTNKSLGSKRLNDLKLSDDQALGIMAAREDKSFENISLKLDGNMAFLEKSTDSFFYSMIENHATAMNPLIHVIGKDQGLKAAFYGRALSKESVENNEALKLIVYNDKYFHEYKLVTTTLPIMNLDCKKEISEEDSKMEMTLYDNRANSSSRVIKSDGLIRFRGATTLYYPKKGLKLSLTQKSVGNNRRNNDISLLGLRQDDDWILYAAYNDQEKVRNVFSHNLWEYSCAKDNSRHIDAGMEYKYLELFVNGQYYGLYALGSPIDEMQLELSGDVRKDALYKSIYWSTLDGIMMPENTVTGFETKSSPAILSNGVLNEDGTITVNGTGQTVIDNSAWNLFLDYCNYLEENRNDSKKLMEAIDEDNAIDFYLFMTLIQGMDTSLGYQSKNYYFSVSKEGEKLYSLYLPWDMDISWGNYWTGDIDVNFTIPYGVKSYENYLFEQGYLNQIIVNNDTDISKAIFDKYKKLREGYWSDESLNKMIDSYEAAIYGSGAFRREKERWPEGTYNEASEGLDKFRSYVEKRLTETDEYIERLESVFNKSILVRRSAQYKGFLDCDFFIAINSPEVLRDSDYLDLFEYIGIDTSRLSQSTTMILYNSKEKKAEILTEPIANGFSYDSVIGKLSLDRKEDGVYFTEEDFGIYVDDTYVYDTVSIYEPALRFYFIDKHGARTMELKKDYKLDIMVSTFNDLKLYLKVLNMFDYEVRLEYASEDFLKDKEIWAYLENLGDKVVLEENYDLAGISIVVTDSFTGQLIDTVYYEYVVDKSMGKDILRTTNCVRQ